MKMNTCDYDMYIFKRFYEKTSADNNFPYL